MAKTAKTAKTRDKQLVKNLRASGVRRKVAEQLGQAAGDRRGRNHKLVTRAAQTLREAAEHLEDRVGAEERSRAAQKAARTRKREAAKRSASARKGAATRKRRGH